MAKQVAEKAIKKQADLFGKTEAVPAVADTSISKSLPLVVELSAGHLLSFATEQQAAAEFSVVVPSSIAEQLLERYPPELLRVGHRLIMVGNAKLSCALLKCVPADLLVKHQLLSATVPFSGIDLALDSLLVEPDMPSRIQSFATLVENLIGKKPSLGEIGAAHNRTPSAISKILRNKASE